jgi:uncharacterized protein (DUF305 family)
MRFLIASLFATASVACSSAATTPSTTPGPAASPGGDLPLTTPAAIAKARADSARYPYTAADVAFMTGMIGHHAQAVVMSRWAESHGANPEVQRLAARIINAQRDEIFIMRRWLADRQQPVPPPEYVPMEMSAGHAMHTMMPGMLTEAQLAELDAARGARFDELFLRFMIQHHGGAVQMVDQLFATDGAAQDELTFKFANDVQVDQRTEINRMTRLLADVLFNAAG